VTNNPLEDQLEDLFSDFSAPEPDASPETVTGDRPMPLHGMQTVPTSLLHGAADAVQMEVQAEPYPDPAVQLDATQPLQAERRRSPEEGQAVKERWRFLPPTVRRILLRWKSSLGHKLVLAFLAAAIIPSLIISLFGVLSQISRVRSSVADNLELVANLQKNQVDQWVQSQTTVLKTLAHEPSLVQQIRTYLTAGQSDKKSITASGTPSAPADGTQSDVLSIEARLNSFRVQHPNFDEVFLLDEQGLVTVGTNTAHLGQLEPELLHLVEQSEESYYGPPVPLERSNGLRIVVAEPLRYITGENIGALVGLVNPAPLTQLMQASPGLGETGQVYLVNANGELVTSLTNSVASTEKRNDAPAPGDPITSPGIQEAITGESGHSTYDNYAGQSVLGVYHWLPASQMGILVEREVTEAFSPLFMAVSTTLVVALIAVVLTALLARQLVLRIAKPIVRITEAARQMVAGELNQPVVVRRTDEIGVLGQAFNDMGEQLRMTIAGLEAKVAERTRELQRANYQFQKRAIHLETSAEISRAAASILDPQELMQTTADLIRDRFNVYHASLFVLDETGEWAVVRASTGAVGRQMVAQPHRLRVGHESMVGWVCAQRQARIALDVGTDAVHFDNPLLPHTRSEMVLPLLVGDRLLGALDVQSSDEAAFDDDDVRSLQGMADLIAVALENAGLFAATRRSAQHQRFIAQYTNRLQRATSVADVLTYTLEELGETFDLAQATVCLSTEADLETGGIRDVSIHSIPA
jgi:putative methionine-R-sulfoxide reductase with GAF domain/HAMP domain-containing protein